MPELAIDKKTQWECIRCGACCEGIIVGKSRDISVIKRGKPVCKYLDEDSKLCLNYENRPFICRIYPFVLDMDAIKGADGVARPQQAFKLENLKIHSECPGLGKGRRIYANKNLLKKLEKLALEFAINYKRYINKEIKIDELI